MTQISNFVKQAEEKQETMKVMIEKAAKRNPQALREADPGKNVTLMSKNELAAQFLPSSVKVEIEK